MASTENYPNRTENRPMSNVYLDTEKPENLRTVYKELCSSYRAIDDPPQQLIEPEPAALHFALRIGMEFKLRRFVWLD